MDIFHGVCVLLWWSRGFWRIKGNIANLILGLRVKGQKADRNSGSRCKAEFNKIVTPPCISPSAHVVWHVQYHYPFF